MSTTTIGGFVKRAVIGTIKWTVISFLGLMALVGIMIHSAGTPEERQAKAEKEAAAAAIEARDQPKRIALRRWLHENVNDPRSLKIERIYVSPVNSEVVCGIYEARNGFGNMIRGYVIMHGNRVAQNRQQFNQFCNL